MIWFFSILLLLLSQPCISGVTSVSGNAPEYSGTSIVFYEYLEGVFQTRRPVFQFTPDTKGDFHAEFIIDETKFLFTETGALLCYFYAAPGKSYHLEMPARREKTPEEIRNPFFIPAEVHLPVSVENHTDCPDINKAVREYDKVFDPFYNQQIVRYYLPGYSREKTDSFLLAVKPVTDACDEGYFTSYSLYKTGLLEFTVSQFNMTEIISRYFLDKPVCFTVPSYWELFNKVFDKYFGFLTNKEEFRDLYGYITGGNFAAMDSLLKYDPVLKNDTIRGLVMMNEIYKDFHDGYLSVSGLSVLLDSVSAGYDAELIRELAVFVKEKALRLLPGSDVPDLLLTDGTGRSFHISDMQGNFIYLGFCHPRLAECLRELEYLRYYRDQFRDRLIIITVLDDVTGEDISRLAREHDYTWILARLTEPEKAFRDFNIRGFPAFFFIGPDNRFIQSPALFPSNGFEKILVSALRNSTEKNGL